MKYPWLSKNLKYVFLGLYIALTLVIFIESLTPAAASAEKTKAVAAVLGEVFNVDDTGKSAHENLPTSIELSSNREGNVFGIGETFDVVSKILPEVDYGFSEKWTSSDSEVLTVSGKGEVRCVGAGTATITCLFSIPSIVVYRRELTVTVSKDVAVPERTFFVTDGTRQPITAKTVYYGTTNNAPIGYPLFIVTNAVLSDNSDVLITSSDNSVVQIIKTGTSIPRFVLQTRGVGTATVTATCTAIVGTSEVPLESHLTVSVKSSNFAPLSSVDLGGDIELNQYESKAINITSLPADAATFSRRYYWVVSKRSVADVIKYSPADETFIVEAYTEGTTTITAYSYGSNEIFDSFEVTVVKSPVTSLTLSCPNTALRAGSSARVTVDFGGKRPSNPKIVWSSSDETVGYIEGNIFYAKNRGTVTLTATSVDNPEVSASFTAKVKPNFYNFVRKGVGHFGLFFALGVLAFLTYGRLIPSKKLSLAVCCLAGVATAGLSEILQLPVFTKNRYATFSDVLVDTCGFLCAVGASLFISFIFKRIKRKRLAKNENNADYLI